MTETRKFPVGPAAPKQRYVNIPINDDGTPIKESSQWQTMIANAIARAPEDRSPAERAAVRREMESSQ